MLKKTRILDVGSLTERLVCALAPALPDPIETPFEVIEPRFAAAINQLWACRDTWRPIALECAPLWVFPIRIMIMYLNLSDAFYGCGTAYLAAARREDEFLARHRDAVGASSRLELASRLLARAVMLAREMGFHGKLFTGSADLHYSGACSESERWARAFAATAGVELPPP